MAPPQELPHIQDSKNPGLPVPISLTAKPDPEFVDPSKTVSHSAGEGTLASPCHVPFRNLSYVTPEITLESFVPPRSNHGLIFGPSADPAKDPGSIWAPSSLPASRRNTFKRPPRSFSDIVASANVNSSSNVISEKPAPTLLTCPGPRPPLLPSFDFESPYKSGLAPPVVTPSATGTRDIIPVRTSSLHAPTNPQFRFVPEPGIDSAGTCHIPGIKRKLRAVPISGKNRTTLAKAAATSNTSGIPQGGSFAERVRSKVANVKKSLFSDSAAAILDYQRDTRYAAVDPQKPAPRKPNKIPEEVPGKRSSFNKCNECEEFEGAYTDCEHFDNDEPYDFTLDKAQRGVRVTPALIDIKPLPLDFETFGRDSKGNWKTFYPTDMFNARNISSLLSENVDKHASKYLMHSLHGTLLGYSDGTTIMQARRIAALTGLTWRNKIASLYDGSDLDAFTRVADVKILQTTTNKEDGLLRQMVLEIDGLWLAVCYIREQIVVSAMIEKDIDPNEEKERAEFKAARLAEKAKEKAAREGKDNDLNGGTESRSKEGKAAASDRKAGGSDGKEAAPNNDSDAIKSAGAITDERPPSPTKSVSTDHTGSTREVTESEWDEVLGRNEPPVKTIPHDQEPGKIQILKWKAEGMAAVMLKDMKVFKMPTGGY